MKSMRLYLAVAASLFVTGWSSTGAERLNVLIITTDDMSCDSVGVYGCKLPDTTPNMDRLASQSLRFNHAHVQVGNCMPSRNVMFSGRYPHNNRVEGFYQITDPGYPVMADLMKEGGYLTGIRHKVGHSTPYHPYPAWDMVLDDLEDGSKAHPKNVESYYHSTKRGIAAAKKAGKPFCLNINIADPHKPFYTEGAQPDPNVPSRVFTSAEVPVPGFLFEDRAVREELALYYSSVRRADDCLGAILRALDESGATDSTLVIFLSDHGMPLPFAKTQLYLHSTRTPWMVRWPGVTKPGSVDDRHMISGVDLLPTLLDIVGLRHPQGMDGRSFEPLLRGRTQENRGFVVTEYNENAGGHRHPMRSIVSKEFAYIFNPWSNGERVMATATKGTVTYRRMQALAKSNPEIAARLELFERRVPEELYNYGGDPDALGNLIDKAEYRPELERLTRALDQWMVTTGDPMLEVFRKRHDPAAREAYMQQVEKEAAERNSTRKRRGKRAATAPSVGRNSVSKVAPKPADLISLEIPKSIAHGQTVVVKIPHAIPTNLGEQLLQVTLKGPDERRLERKVVKVSGNGVCEVPFPVPDNLRGKTVRFAVFIGADFAKNLQHINSERIPVH